MAIDYNQFIKTKERCIRRNKKDRRCFLLDFRVNGKRYRKIVKVGTKDAHPKTNLVKARLLLEELKEKLRNELPSHTLTLNQLFYEYMKDKKSTAWNNKKRDNYDLYIGDSGLPHSKPVSTKDNTQTRKLYVASKIGHMKITNIKPMHIEKIISVMAKHGLSPRTQKGIVEILNPLFKNAIQNHYIDKNPSEFIKVKVPSQKKVVTNASDLFRKVHNGICEYYKDNPFYRAYFLFGFTGRRKSEILKMKWNNIDLDGNYYWIEETKNGEVQKFPLPAMVKEALLAMEGKRMGYVFKGADGGHLKNTDRQTKNLREFIGEENLTMHYMRNILVSALAENSVEAITLSGVLGHKQVGTINKYLSQNTMKSGMKSLSVIDTILH